MVGERFIYQWTASLFSMIEDIECRVFQELLLR
jgi:hypothetical protein